MARSLLNVFPSSVAGGRPVFSVTQDPTANAAFQAAPSWLTRSARPSANDLFGNLVSQNTPSDSNAAPPPPPPPPNNADASPPPQSDNKPPANHAGNNAAPANSNNPSNPPPARNNSDNAAGNDGSASNASSDAGASANSNGAAANGTSQSTTTTASTTTSDTSKPGDHKSKGDATDANAIAVDATLLAQQVGGAPTTPTPVAAPVPTSTPVTNTPSAPSSSGGPTAPLAIAAAAIAASSQSPSPSGPAVPGKSDPGTTSTAASGGAQVETKVAVAGNTPPADPSALTTAVAATTPVTAKTTQGKAQAAANRTAANPTSADANATNATTDSALNTATAQTSTTGKPETANLAVQNTTTDAATVTPGASTHDHAAPAANVAHVAADVADPSAQALGATPQLNSASNLTSANNLTATPATGGAVPLSGLAVEIVANVKSGKSSFEIRLDPADLGRIDVRVQIDQNGQVTSHLTVEKPETLSMLRQDAPQLQQALNDAGLKTDSGGLQFSLRDQSSSGQNNANDNNPNAQRLVISDEDAVPAAVAGRSYGRSLGSSGGVDITV
jgi:flagellar hook-length control protein FliK